MRRAVLWLGAGLILAAPQIVQADELTIGILAFDNPTPGLPGFPGVNAFDITNLTGDLSDTMNAATFTNASLTLSDGTVIALKDIGSLDFIPAAQFPDTVNFSSAEFKATLDQTSFLLPTGDTFDATSANIDVILAPSPGNSFLQVGDLVPINVSNAPAPVPEPSSLFVLMSGCLWAFCRSRRVGRQS